MVQYSNHIRVNGIPYRIIIPWEKVEEESRVPPRCCADATAWLLRDEHTEEDEPQLETKHINFHDSASGMTCVYQSTWINFKFFDIYFHNIMKPFLRYLPWISSLSIESVINWVQNIHHRNHKNRINGPAAYLGPGLILSPKFDGTLTGGSGEKVFWTNLRIFPIIY